MSQCPLGEKHHLAALHIINGLPVVFTVDSVFSRKSTRQLDYYPPKEGGLEAARSPTREVRKDALSEYLDIVLCGKTVSVVNKKPRLFVANPLRK